MLPLIKQLTDVSNITQYSNREMERAKKKAHLKLCRNKTYPHYQCSYNFHYYFIFDKPLTNQELSADRLLIAISALSSFLRKCFLFVCV